jgi:hypothetical protein
MAKNPTDVDYVSKIGTFSFPYLEDKDTQFAESEEAAYYQTRLRLEDAELEEYKKKCDEVFAASGLQRSKRSHSYPIKIDNKTDEEFLIAKTKHKPKVYDAKKRPVSGKVGGGSQGRLAGRLHPWMIAGKSGVTFYLFDAQITKLVAKGSGGAGGGMMDALEMDDEEDTGPELGVIDNGDLDI